MPVTRPIRFDRENTVAAKHEVEAAVDICMVELATTLLSSDATLAADLALISKPETRERIRTALGTVVVDKKE